MAQHARKEGLEMRRGMKPAATAVVFFLVAGLMVALDRATKEMFDTGNPGQVLVEDIAGLFEFRLVHNTGGAWGIFGGSPIPLGVFSVIVCLVIVWYVFGARHARTTFLETVALALVLAGGLGNAVDRFSQGYVVDFINCKFMTFPVFNVADICVTCGIVLFLIVLAFVLKPAKQ